MPKQFYQCDVAESDTESLWTGPVIYGTASYAEFQTMLELQRDWGDGYMPDTFIDTFGAEGSEVELQTGEAQPAPEYPGDEAWDAAGYFDDIPSGCVTGMLTLNAATALAKLGKIEIAADVDIEALLADDNAKLLACGNPPPAGELARCASCDEPRTEEASSHQQWQCACCSAWNDKTAEEQAA